MWLFLNSNVSFLQIWQDFCPKNPLGFNLSSYAIINSNDLEHGLFGINVLGGKVPKLYVTNRNIMHSGNIFHACQPICQLTLLTTNIREWGYINYLYLLPFLLRLNLSLLQTNCNRIAPDTLLTQTSTIPLPLYILLTYWIPPTICFFFASDYSIRSLLWPLI